MRAGLTQLGGTAGKVGLAAAAGLGAVVLTAAKFDKAMSSVQAATHETAGNMGRLREAAIKAGADTAYSASEAAGAIEELAKAGVSTADILEGGLAGSLDLAAAGAIEVGEAAELAATAMTQFKLDGDQVGHVADLMAAGAGKAQGSVGDLGMALKQSGLVAAQTGLSIEETVGTLSAFASAGLLGSDAGTSFKTMLQSLTPTGVKAKEAMADLGISAYDAQGDFVGMTEFAGQLREALSTLTTEQQNAALKTIFGSDAVRAAAVIYSQGADGIQEWIDKTNDAGYAAETAGKRMDNLAGDWEEFTGSLETALIGAGTGSQGPLRQLVQNATDVVNAFNKLPQSGQNAATGLLAVTAVTGGGLWFTSKVVSGISDTKHALDDLGISSQRVGRSLKTIAGLGTAATVLLAVEQAAAELVRSSDDAAPAVEALTRNILNLQTAQGLKGLASDLGDLNQSVEMLSDPGLAQNMGNVYDKVPLIGSAFADIAPGLRGARQEAREAAVDLEAVDQALAGIVAQGSGEQAISMFEGLAEVYGMTADQQENFLALLPQYQEALAAEANSAQLAADATEDLGPAGKTAAAGLGQSAEAAKKAAARLKEAKGAARDTAKGFITLGDSLNNGKKSLSQWMSELEQQAEALRNFTKNAQTAARRGLNEGLIKSLNEAGPAGALRMKQLANATDEEIKRANKAWREGQAAIRDYVNMKVPEKTLKVDNSQALSAVAFLQARIDSLRSKTIAIDIATGQRRAGGGPIYGPGTKTSDSVPVMASVGEFMMSAAAVDHYGLDTMFAMNARRLASGGDVTGRPDRSLDSRLEIVGLLQSIRDLRRDLDARIKKGKNKGELEIQGLDRKRALLELEAAERDLRRAKNAEEREARQEAREKAREQREARRDLKAGMGGMFDSILPGPELTTSQQVAATIRDFRQQWEEAGGRWTKELRAWAKESRLAAREYDRISTAIVTYVDKVDGLNRTLSEQQSAYNELTSTMKSFGDSVASNFLGNAFNGQRTERVAGEAGPATAALQQARDELAALRASATGDSVQAAAAAAELISRIRDLEQQAEDETRDREVEVSGLDALRETLARDTKNAQDFAAALATLAGKGLDTSGNLGGLYAQLAASGDLLTAQQMANLTAAQIDELEKAYQAREDAAASVAAQVVQERYGADQAAMQQAMAQTQSAIDTANASLVILEASLPVIAEQVRAGAAVAADILSPKVQAVRAAADRTTAAVQDVARQMAENAKKAKV